MMSLMNVVLFGNCTYFSYTVITSNYNSYTNLIGTELYDALESMSILKLLILIFTFK